MHVVKPTPAALACAVHVQFSIPWILPISITRAMHACALCTCSAICKHVIIDLHCAHTHGVYLCVLFLVCIIHLYMYMYTVFIIISLCKSPSPFSDYYMKSHVLASICYMYKYIRIHKLIKTVTASTLAICDLWPRFVAFLQYCLSNTESAEI